MSEYDVLGELGRGAGSMILRVTDRRGELYALKQVVRASPRDDRYIDQAVCEYHVGRRFNHPALRRSFELIKDRSIVGTLRGVLLTMELVEGETLEHFPWTRVAELIPIFANTASALKLMHEQGYVHADIKPTNIILTSGPQQQVKLIDFGHACRVGTVKPRIQGTPDYIAPEQQRRKPITEQTDVFNFGATMYRVLTGRAVPTGMHPGEAGMRRLESEPLVPPSKLNPDVPPALSAVVIDSVQARLGARPASMDAVLHRLQVAAEQTAAAQHHGASPVAAARKPPRRDKASQQVRADARRQERAETSAEKSADELREENNGQPAESEQGKDKDKDEDKGEDKGERETKKATKAQDADAAKGRANPARQRRH